MNSLRVFGVPTGAYSPMLGAFAEKMLHGFQKGAILKLHDEINGAACFLCGVAIKLVAVLEQVKPSALFDAKGVVSAVGQFIAVHGGVVDEVDAVRLRDLFLGVGRWHGRTSNRQRIFVFLGIRAAQVLFFVGFVLVFQHISELLAFGRQIFFNLLRYVSNVAADPQQLSISSSPLYNWKP